MSYTPVSWPVDERLKLALTSLCRYNNLKGFVAKLVCLIDRGLSFFACPSLSSTESFFFFIGYNNWQRWWQDGEKRAQLQIISSQIWQITSQTLKPATFVSSQVWMLYLLNSSQTAAITGIACSTELFASTDLHTGLRHKNCTRLKMFE